MRDPPCRFRLVVRATFGILPALAAPRRPGVRSVSQAWGRMFSARSISLFAVLYGIWLLLSGIWTPFLMIAGAVCCAIVVFIAARMDVIDGEGHPIGWSWRAPIYLPWLFWQIVLSNIAVARLIVAPSMPISPTVGMIPASQKTDVGMVTFANSITLTPGTVSLAVHPGRIHVHALTRGGFDDLMGGEMDRRVRQLEGAR
jgi:multicomponent Na+:H+ antiporter subunit E